MSLPEYKRGPILRALARIAGVGIDSTQMTEVSSLLHPESTDVDQVLLLQAYMLGRAHQRNVNRRASRARR